MSEVMDESKTKQMKSKKSSNKLKLAPTEMDPLSINNHKQDRIILENLTIRTEDEIRIVSAMNKAVKKQTTGSLYSVKVDIGRTGTLGIGVKDLSENILAVSMLKRENGRPGAGEEAGIRLGDIIFGINFIPTREGSRTLIAMIKRETERGKSFIHVQGWRCHQLCSDSMPGYLFPKADDVIVQAFALYHNKVFSDWERWNFVEILLGHLVEDLKIRIKSGTTDDTDGVQAKQMQVLDLEKNILQAKGLRTALCVRIVNAKHQGDSVTYALRVEDVESGLNWVVHRRYRDFFALNEELIDMSPFVQEIEFPKKRMTLRITLKLVENRIVALEQYTRKLLNQLTVYATMDSSASRSLRHLQNFLGVDKFVDCIRPPIVDDQRFVELMAYRFLNDYNSPACQQCVRFIQDVDLDSLVSIGENGYFAVLEHVKIALAEVEQFVLQQHQQQMVHSLKHRNPDLAQDALMSFVRKCVRRQVEAAVYLPLRRTVFRIVYSFLSEKSREMMHAMAILQQAPSTYFMVDPYLLQAKSLPNSVKAFRKVMQAYLPADQGQLLIEAANAVMELHKECVKEKLRVIMEKQKNGDSQMDSTHELRSGESSPNGYNKHDITNASRIDRNSNGTGCNSLLGLSVSMKNIMISPWKTSSKDTNDNYSHGLDSSPSFSHRKNSNLNITSLSSFFRNGNNVREINNNGNIMDYPPGDMMNGNGKEVFVDNIPLNNDNKSPIIYDPQQDDVIFSKPDLSRVTFTLNNNNNSNNNSSNNYNDSVERDTITHINFSINHNNPNNIIINNGDRNSTRHSVNMNGLNKGIPSPLRAAHRGSLKLYATVVTDQNPSTHHSQSKNNNNQLNDDVLNSSNDSDTSALSVNEVNLEEYENMLNSNMYSSNNKHPASVPTLDENIDRSSAYPFQLPTQPDHSSPHNNNSSLTHNNQNYNHNKLSKSKSKTIDGYDSGCIDMSPTLTIPYENGGNNNNDNQEDINNEMDPMTAAHMQQNVISADDFLPLFTFVLVQAGLPQLVLVKELMTQLVDDEETYGECGYYLATLEAATQHILDLAGQYEKIAKLDHIFDESDEMFLF
eukprot:gene7258-9895_t